MTEQQLAVLATGLELIRANDAAADKGMDGRSDAARRMRAFNDAHDRHWDALRAMAREHEQDMARIDTGRPGLHGCPDGSNDAWWDDASYAAYQARD